MTSLTQAQFKVLVEIRANPGKKLVCSQLTINSLEKRGLIQLIRSVNRTLARADGAYIDPKMHWKITHNGIAVLETILRDKSMSYTKQFENAQIGDDWQN